jgi:hypothetical protein
MSIEVLDKVFDVCMEIVGTVSGENLVLSMMEHADPGFDFLDFVRGFTGLSTSMDDVEVDLPEIALALPHGLNKTREESRDIEAALRTIRRAPRNGKVKIRSPGASKESFCECSPSEGLLN